MTAVRHALTTQLQAWQGDFGNAYTDRNQVDWRQRFSAFERIVRGLSIHSVLEVGCNRGHNLVALSQVANGPRELAGVEPNLHARQIAKESAVGASIHPGNAFELPFGDGTFDLVFTSCVLIHVAPGDLSRALSEIVRVSRRYILAIEYFASTPTVIHYRGHDELLWKRDFGADYRACFPDLVLTQNGSLGPADGFDECAWWLFCKPARNDGGEE